jgi:hypothetical protein
MAWSANNKKESRFFEKKGDAPCGRRKKLLLCWFWGVQNPKPQAESFKSLFVFGGA